MKNYTVLSNYEFSRMNGSDSMITGLTTRNQQKSMSIRILFSQPSSKMLCIAAGAILDKKPPNLLTILALVIALILLIPIITVASHLFQNSPNIDHLITTVLPRYIRNTAWLMVLVALGTGLLGTGCAWLTVMCRFPGQRLFEWALVLPLAAPAYVLAYAYTDFFTAFWAGTNRSTLFVRLGTT